MPIRSVVTYNTMISGLMRYGLVDAAFEVFDGMPDPDKVSWTALIDGFVKNGHHDEAIDCFHAMLLDSVKPDYVTLIAVVSACAEVGSLGLGMWVHRLVLRQGLERNVRVANSLIDMYARCGQVNLAAQVFRSDGGLLELDDRRVRSQWPMHGRDRALRGDAEAGVQAGRGDAHRRPHGLQPCRSH
jgi:pentatricopeptide repeat protein